MFFNIIPTKDLSIKEINVLVLMNYVQRRCIVSYITQYDYLVLSVNLDEFIDTIFR